MAEIFVRGLIKTNSTRFEETPRPDEMPRLFGCAEHALNNHILI